jgi:hypothetical protein
VRLDVDYFANPKTLAAGRDGRDLHLASITWCARYLTDGHIPADAVTHIAHDAGLAQRAVKRAVERAVEAGLWRVCEAGYELKDFVEMNGSRASVETQRDQWRARQRRARTSSPDSHGVTGE